VSELLRHAAFIVMLLAAPWAAWAQPDQACLGCHPAPGLKGRLLLVGGTAPAEEMARFLGSAHRQLSCADCHPGATPGPHQTLPATRQCVDCHRPEGSAGGYKTAPLITQLHAGKTPQSPHCETCHGHHGIGRPDDPESGVYWNRVPRLCGSCHAKANLAQWVPQVPGYFKSIHGRIAAQRDERRPAVCSDCHLLHKVEQKTPRAGQTTIVPERAIRSRICGQCHKQEAAQYEGSVHGAAVARGVTDAAVCTDCHGEHEVQAVTSEQSAVSPGKVVATCAGCHANARFVRLHKLPTAPVTTYLQSFHGMANQYGDVAVANCTSCHGTHDILSASSPRSSVNPHNLTATCGKCHPGAGTSFPIGRVHIAPRISDSSILLLIQVVYILLILGSLAAFVGYIVLDLFAHWRLKQAGVLEKLEHEMRHLPEAPPSALVRMLPFERAQHFVLLISFFVLAITGLVLLIPNSAFGQFVVMLCGGPIGRAIVHRVAAVIMMLNFVVQLIWMATARRGRDTLRRLLPALQDLRDVWQSVTLFLGFSRHRPSFRRYGYPEKFEFWALVWGTFIMSITGLLLWFVNWTLAHGPKLVLDIVTIIHKWEAILAVLAIVIWHLYHVLWKPGVFPGNRAWLTGKIDFEQLVFEHPLDYAEAMGWLPGPGEKTEETPSPEGDEEEK
jgi:formate dehydrogenase gamma subunit